MQVEQVDFVSVPTRDMSRALAFYREVLGLPESEYSEGEDENGNDMELTAGQVTLDIFDPTSFAPSPAGVALRVADVAAARAELEAKGVEFQGETFDTGVCHMAFFNDPDGNALMLHHRYSPREGAAS